MTRPRCARDRGEDCGVGGGQSGHSSTPRWPATAGGARRAGAHSVPSGWVDRPVGLRGSGHTASGDGPRFPCWAATVRVVRQGHAVAHQVRPVPLAAAAPADRFRTGQPAPTRVRGARKARDRRTFPSRFGDARRHRYPPSGPMRRGMRRAFRGTVHIQAVPAPRVLPGAMPPCSGCAPGRTAASGEGPPRPGSRCAPIPAAWRGARGCRATPRDPSGVGRQSGGGGPRSRRARPACVWGNRSPKRQRGRPTSRREGDRAAARLPIPTGTLPKDALSRARPGKVGYHCDHGRREGKPVHAKLGDGSPAPGGAQGCGV